LQTAANHTDRSVLVSGSVSIAGSTGAWTGMLDLGGNDAIIHNGQLAAITDQVHSGLTGTSNNLWTGPGITSSAATAANDSRGIVAIGISEMDSGTFDGVNLSSGDVVMKETFFGDADLSGSVDAGDYSMIDNGYAMGLTGWANGDFNYDGVIDAADYSLIDSAYAFQTSPGGPTAPLASELAAISDGGEASTSSVPEPTGAGLLAMAATGLLVARRRRRVPVRILACQHWLSRRAR
jgi:hypothetical protein